MHTQDIVEAWENRAIQKGRVEGRVEGRTEGLAQALIDLYEARFGAIPDDLRAVIADTHDDAALRAWVKISGTVSADEIAETIRRSRCG